MSSTELDVQQIQRFNVGVEPKVGDVEYIEDATNMHRVKRYEFDGNTWIFKDYVGRCELVVVGTTKRTCDAVTVCDTPKRGMHTVVKNLIHLANLVSKGENVKALVKIQEFMDSINTNAPKRKKAPSAYNMFIAQQLAHLKESHPDKSNRERFALAVNAWKSRAQ